MKKFLLFILLTTNIVIGQTIQDLGINYTVTSNSYSMVKVGNFIYYTNASPTGSNRVYKFDYTLSNPQPTIVTALTSGFSFLTGIVHHNGFLYVAANNCIWKIDINTPNAIPQVYYYNDIGTTTYNTKNVFSLCVINDELYFNSTFFSPTLSSRILKINLLDNIPNPIIVKSNIPYSIGSILNLNNDMYFSTLNSGNGVAICKFNYTDSNSIISNVINDSGYICRIAYFKNRIYFPNETSGTVKSFDPLETSPYVRNEFNLSRAAGILGVDCDLYVGTTTSATTNRLVKVRTPFVTGSNLQTFDFTDPTQITIEDLIVTGSNITWFNTISDAIANINAIAPNTQLIQGSTYYAVATEGTCRSLPFAVNTAVLSNDDFNFNSFKIYPNPTKQYLNIDFNEIISDTEIFISNIQGQIMKKIKINSISNIMIEMPEMPGIYFVQLKSEKINKIFKIIKE